ncbi:hypothetical protein HG530_000573 [Fusarium avenaceum]|nr:hypothetical protein HG530_000573 [Fusarium avenaceum]
MPRGLLCEARHCKFGDASSLNLLAPLALPHLGSLCLLGHNSLLAHLIQHGTLQAEIAGLAAGANVEVAYPETNLALNLVTVSVGPEASAVDLSDYAVIISVGWESTSLDRSVELAEANNANMSFGLQVDAALHPGTTAWYEKLDIGCDPTKANSGLTLGHDSRRRLVIGGCAIASGVFAKSDVLIVEKNTAQRRHVLVQEVLQMLVLAVGNWLRPANGEEWLVKRHGLDEEGELRVRRDIGRISIGGRSVFSSLFGSRRILLGLLVLFGTICRFGVFLLLLGLLLLLAVRYSWSVCLWRSNFFHIVMLLLFMLLLGLRLVYCSSLGLLLRISLFGVLVLLALLLFLLGLQVASGFSRRNL